MISFTFKINLNIIHAPLLLRITQLNLQELDKLKSIKSSELSEGNRAAHITLELINI